MLRIFPGLILSAALLAASTGLAAAQSDSIQVKAAPNGVNYLTDGNGITLYYYTLDTNGQSACYGPCEKAWPAFTADSFVVPSALNASDFGTITRSDGASQATYKGYSLCYWVKDKMHGDVTGQNVGKVWYVIDPDKFPPKM